MILQELDNKNGFIYFLLFLTKSQNKIISKLNFPTSNNGKTMIEVLGQFMMKLMSN